MVINDAWAPSSRRRILLPLTVLALLLVVQGGRAATILPVTGTVTEGTCDVLLSTNTSTTASATSTLELGAMNPKAILSGGVVTGDGLLKLQLGGCLGSNVSGSPKAPSVQVKATGGVLTAGGGYIIKNTLTGGAAADPRVGVVMVKDSVPQNSTQVWTPADYIKPGDFIALGKPGDNGGNQFTSYRFGVSCGRDATECDAVAKPSVGFGGVRAELTFDFAYH